MDITVAFYDDSTGGTEVFAEGYFGVEVSEGLFSLPLGHDDSFDGVDFSEPIWVEVQVDGDSPMTPRLPLASAGTALLAVDALYTDSGPVPAAAFGAVGDGVTDDTEALQAWVADLVEHGGTYYLGPGTYVQNEVLTIIGATDFVIDGGRGTLAFADGGRVDYSGACIRLQRCSNFEIRNLNVFGNRAGREEDITAGASHSFPILGCHDFVLSNVHVEDPVADGFYFGIQSVGADSTAFCRNGMVVNCSASRAYRLGAAVINAHDLMFVGGSYTGAGATVNGTEGVLPKAGIDVEANEGAGPIPGNANIQFIGVDFRNTRETWTPVVLEERAPHVSGHRLPFCSKPYRYVPGDLRGNRRYRDQRLYLSEL